MVCKNSHRSKMQFVMGEQAAALKSPTDAQQHASLQQGCSSMHMYIVNGSMCHKVALEIAVACC